MDKSNSSTLREDAEYIIRNTLDDALPEAVVRTSLQSLALADRVYIAAVGKAAWRMASAAREFLGERVKGGIVITKYGHSMGPIDGLEIHEAGHPLVDENSIQATGRAIALLSQLDAADCVLFLVSGGGSALFEKPLVPLEELQDINRQLLACGANIREINSIRKRLSAVKGGRFAQLCTPARVVSVILSDIVGDPMDMIASGPTCPDSSICSDALAVAKKYGLCLSDAARKLLQKETVKELKNVENHITGSVRQLCASAAKYAKELGYRPVLLSERLDCIASDYGRRLAVLAQEKGGCGEALALIAGGETLVRLTGKGKGGRNQELALAAADGIAGMNNVCVFSVGSDGTDGPTDAAGGYVDGLTAEKLKTRGLNAEEILKENDSYNGLKLADGLIITGPTGTNVNDFCCLLIRPELGGPGLLS